jgi:hypothetical protein
MVDAMYETPGSGLKKLTITADYALEKIQHAHFETDTINS